MIWSSPSAAWSSACPPCWLILADPWPLRQVSKHCSSQHCRHLTLGCALPLGEAGSQDAHFRLMGNQALRPPVNPQILNALSLLTVDWDLPNLTSTRKIIFCFFRVLSWRKHIVVFFFFFFLEYKVLYQAYEHLGLLLPHFCLRNDRGSN